MALDVPTPPASQGDRAALSVEEAAARLGISRALVFRLIARGEFPSVRLGGRRLVPVAALELWLADAVERQQADREGRG